MLPWNFPKFPQLFPSSQSPFSILTLIILNHYINMIWHQHSRRTLWLPTPIAPPTIVDFPMPRFLFQAPRTRLRRRVLSMEPRQLQLYRRVGHSMDKHFCLWAHQVNGTGFSPPSLPKGTVSSLSTGTKHRIRLSPYQCVSLRLPVLLIKKWPREREYPYRYYRQLIYYHTILNATIN